MLKLTCLSVCCGCFFAAAFGRLCVETNLNFSSAGGSAIAAAFGRLCVETILGGDWYGKENAAAFGRLCVETSAAVVMISKFLTSSRLRAAVC